MVHTDDPPMGQGDVGYDEHQPKCHSLISSLERPSMVYRLQNTQHVRWYVDKFGILCSLVSHSFGMLRYTKIYYIYSTSIYIYIFTVGMLSLIIGIHQYGNATPYLLLVKYGRFFQ